MPYTDQRKHRRESDSESASHQHNRGEKVLTDIIRRYPFNEVALRKASQILIDAKEPHYSIAMESAARAISRDKIEVFFSFKSDDAAAAKTIVETLRGISGGKLEITFAAEFGEEIVGREYKDKIINAIKNAHWFMLLSPELAADSGWCLFETGLFRGNMVAPTTVNKLICIHPEGSNMPPPPIDEYEAVRGDEASVRQFLNNILCKDNPVPGMPALNPRAEKKLMDWAVNTIVGALNSPIKLVRDYYQNFVRIKVPDTRQLNTANDLNKLEIITDDKTLKMFGKVKTPKTWGELISNVFKKHPDPKWLQEIVSVFIKVGEFNDFRPIQATLEEAHGGKVYRPVLHAMNYDTRSEHPGKVFQLNFIEEVGYSITADIGKPVQALTTVLRMAFRVRWEVIERFSNKQLNQESIDELKDTLQRIELESLSRGFMDEDVVCSNFEPNETIQIRELYKRWYEMRSDRGDGELDRALDNGDVNEIHRILLELGKLNVDFMRLAMIRLEELSFKLPV